MTKINEDLRVGDVVGRLTILSYASSTKDGRIRFNCLCYCGNKKIIRSRCIRDGRTVSCGCRMRESVKLPQGESAKRIAFSQYKLGAKRRNIEYRLSLQESISLFDGPCSYCGTFRSNTITNKRGNGSYNYNGIDRVDNNKGYTLDNCVSCCKICNNAKRTLSREEFLDWIKRFEKHQRKINSLEKDSYVKYNIPFLC